MPLRARVDPCIFLHRDPNDWQLLLAPDLIKALARSVGARDVDELVRRAGESLPKMYLALVGLRISGPYRHEWAAYARMGWIAPGARMRWPSAPNGVELGVYLQLSPCFLLAPYSEYKKTWRDRAASYFRAVLETCQASRRSYLDGFREAFPRWLRELGWSRGYVWVANTRYRGRRNVHLAEWLYWLDTGRMPHIDAMLGKFSGRAPVALALQPQAASGRPGTPANGNVN
ncbi:MAG: hypothetical protein LM577_03930 [Thermoproteaceae archaeon]|nr:hypothetical protein [Thermoproteaceae archaeon]